jgi:hypothetical protein
MALSGQLSDLSLAELIEFFCNQHKTGRLKIAYKKGPGFFYFQNGSLVDSKIGVLSGVEAVYYALTLENASFKFSTAFPPTRRTIHQPWAHVALEGLRRMDEEIKPQEAFPEGDISYLEEPEYKEDMAEETNKQASAKSKAKAAAASSAAVSSNDDSMPLSMMVEEASSSSRGKAIKFGIVAFAVVLLVAAIGVPAGWYKKKQAPTTPAPAQTATQTVPTQAQQQTANQGDSSLSTPFDQAQNKKDEATTDAAKRALEKERERAEKEKKKEEQKQDAAKTEQPKPETKSGPKMVSVTVTYDESGRVTSASGGDPTALRIARQKRFPPGKGGVATVSIPVN